MAAFPDWVSQLSDFFNLQESSEAVQARIRYSLRASSIRGRDEIDPFRAYAFIVHVMDQAGVPMPPDAEAFGYTQFLDPLAPRDSGGVSTRRSGQLPLLSIPSTIQELYSLLSDFEERYEAQQSELMDLEVQRDDDEDRGQDDDDQGDVGVEDATPSAPTYTVGITYTWSGWDGQETILLPGNYELSDDDVAALGPGSRMDAQERLSLFFEELFPNLSDSFKPDGASGTFALDVYVTTDPIGRRPAGFSAEDYADSGAHPLAGGGAATSTSTTSGPVALANPSEVPQFHANLGYRNPSTRLSYDSNALRVDHPGLKYSAQLVEQGESTFLDYQCPWLRANFIPNCCWLSCIIDLVNTTMRRKVLTYERLWTIMGKPGVFDPAEARLGFSIADVAPIFEYFDRNVTILDGEDKLCYTRARSTERKRNHIRPENWAFLMTEHHVVSMNQEDLFRPNIDSRRLVFASSGASCYEEVTIEHSYEVVRPDFPSHEVKKPAILEASEKKSKTMVVRGMVNEDRQRKAVSIMKLCVNELELYDAHSEDDEHVTIHEALFHRRYDGTHLTVICTTSLLTLILLHIIEKYKYKPSITVDKTGYVASIRILSLDNRASVCFRTLLPGQAVQNEVQFQSIAEVMHYMSVRHTFISRLLKANYQSYMHESVAQLCHTYSRGGFFHTFKHSCMDNPRVTYNSCDMNRLYSSTLQVDELPRVDLFNRFEVIANCDDYLRLKPHDLILVGMHDSPTIYSDQPMSLCFKKNLDKFLDRPNVMLSEPYHGIPLSERPSGMTYVIPFAVLGTHMGPSSMNDAISNVWTDSVLSRFLRKFVLNSVIGCLGKKFNSNKSATVSTPCFCNKEEAALHAEQTGDRIVSIQDKLFFALPCLDRVPRLQGGYLMHLWVLDHARWAMQDVYDKLTGAGVTIVKVMCDEFYYPSDQQSIVDDFIYKGDKDSLSAFGRLKLQSENVSLQDIDLRYNKGFNDYMFPTSIDYNFVEECSVPMNRQTLFDVKPAPNEYNVQNLQDYTRLLIKADVPGAGKSHTVLSQCAANCVVVCPTNSLCVEFRNKYPGCQAITLHRFLHIRLSEGDSVDNAYGSGEGLGINKIEANRVLLLDEIYMYPQSLLNRLYSRLLVSRATFVYATGDPNQLPPIEDEQEDRFASRNKENVDFDDFPFMSTSEADDPTYMTMRKRRIKSIEHLFPRQMTLKECKRASHAADNKRMEYLCRVLKDPFAEIGAVDLVKRHFLNVSAVDAVDMLKANPDEHLAVCYYNRTCNSIANLVHPHGLLKPGVRLVNRARYAGKGGVVLQVNYEYTIKEVHDNVVVLEDMDDNLVAVNKRHVQKHMMWWRTRTCHSLQGTSVSGAIIIFDLECPHMTKEFIYVALTRARNLNTVCYVV